MLSIRRILVPTDFSDGSRKALRYAVELARVCGSEILLVHVVESIVLPPRLGLGPVVLPKHEPGIREQIAAALARLQKEEIPAAVASRTFLLDGRAYRQIADAARANEADLIVIATHGHTGLKHAVLGSTTERVVREAPCPVLVVRESERDFVPTPEGGG